MKVGFLITARLKSTRLPKKLLKYLNGYMVIERIIQRAKQVNQCDGIVLCTSDVEHDDPLEAIARHHGIAVYRGQPVNVLERLYRAAQCYQYDCIIGITADNPLFSVEHANRLATRFKQQPGTDYAYTHGLPLGVNVYGMRRCALEMVCQLDIVEDTEIWGKLLDQPDIFNIFVEKVDKKYSRNYRMTLDEESDYHFFSAIYDQFEKETVIDLAAALEYLDRNKNISALNSTVVQRVLDPVVIDKIDDYYREHHDDILELKRHLCH